MRRLSLLVLALFCLAGCGSNPRLGGIPNAPAGAPVALPSLVVEIPPGGLPTTVHSLLFSGFDEDGRRIFGPLLTPKQEVISLYNIPRDVETIGINGLGGSPAVSLASFASSVEITSPPMVIRNPAFVDDTDPVVRSFVSLGCNRLGYGERHLTPSSANSVQLVQDFQEVATRLSPRPTHVFFTGDLVMNEATGTATLTQQLTDWKQ